MENKILSFDLIKVEKGREKICKCNPPHYEIDTVNRIVTCTDCGAIIEPFEALLRICEYTDKLEEYQKKAVEKINIYKELADKEWKRRMKNRAFKEMDKQYQQGLYPICPKCGEKFNPMEITDFTRL